MFDCTTHKKIVKGTHCQYQVALTSTCLGLSTHKKIVKGTHCQYQVALTSTGFPASWKIIENLENEKSVFQTWKNHGIWKKAKIMEKSWYTTNHHFCVALIMEKTWKGSWKIMEKSWNLILGNRWEPWYHITSTKGYRVPADSSHHRERPLPACLQLHYTQAATLLLYQLYNLFWYNEVSKVNLTQ